MKSDGMYAALDASARVECERWAHELLYDGWFSRDDHHALNESLVALLCCYQCPAVGGAMKPGTNSSGNRTSFAKMSRAARATA